MNCSPSLCDPRRRLDQLLAEAGAFRWGIAHAEEVSAEAKQQYDCWLQRGGNASMEWAARYGEVRDDPRLLLEGARSVVVAAFSYATRSLPPRDIPRFARCSLGDDYHDVLRRRMTPVAEALASEFGVVSRVCVDTAPLRERFWAVRAGLGFIGLNNTLIVPGHGSYCFLATLLTTLDFEPDAPLGQQDCGRCGRCAAACPG
ncbi:MAG: DUF1730 domain-containing protein, partial [Clostridium sp.]|nr:DUF1730 domain-containing protein [Clostridium sp.]